MVERRPVKASLLPVAVSLCGIAAALAGCGGAGRAACTFYDSSSSVYFVIRGPGAAQEARSACSMLSRRMARAGQLWSLTKGNHDYSRDVRVCAFHFSGGREMIVYDSRSHRLGGSICKLLKLYGSRLVI